MREFSDAEYQAFIGRLVRNTVDELSRASDERAVRAAIETYLRQGYDANLSREEVTDFFCVSGDSVVDRANLPADQEQTLVRLFDEEHERFINMRKP
jgi:hypothetical protein